MRNLGKILFKIRKILFFTKYYKNRRKNLCNLDLREYFIKKKNCYRVLKQMKKSSKGTYVSLQ